MNDGTYKLTSNSEVTAMAKSDESKSDEQRLRLNVEGEWSVDEFTALFSNTQFLYNAVTLTEAVAEHRASDSFYWQFPKRAIRRLAIEFDDTDEILEYLGGLFAQHWVRGAVEQMIGNYVPLRLGSLLYSSPGHLDFVGAGEVVKQMRLFLEGIFDRFSEDRRIETELKRQAIISKQLDNLNKIFKLLLDRRQAAWLVTALLKVDSFVVDKLIEGKLTSVE